jgi:hypothetical protein
MFTQFYLCMYKLSWHSKLNRSSTFTLLLSKSNSRYSHRDQYANVQWRS